MTKTHYSLTYGEARTLTLVKCETFVEEMPAGGYTTTDVADLAATLNWMASGRAYFRTIYLEDVIGTLVEFAELEAGDHEGLIQTANGVIDEGGRLRDHLNCRLRDHLYFTVADAGYKPTASDLNWSVAA